MSTNAEETWEQQWERKRLAKEELEWSGRLVEVLSDMKAAGRTRSQAFRAVLFAAGWAADTWPVGEHENDDRAKPPAPVGMYGEPDVNLVAAARRSLEGGR